MPPPRVFVLADDLTGAAEIAAVGHRYGLAARVVTGSQIPAGGGPGSLVVVDTDSRLDAPDAAARKVRSAADPLASRAGSFYKKTDSVLRGPVLAEIGACAAAAGLRRTLLVPANPSLGRTLRNGRYFVDGVPLDHTAFANDPHHPARSAVVTELLGAAPDGPVRVLHVGDPLPDAGVAVGEVASAADLDHWAGRVDRTVLPAGGADFFAANLRANGLASTVSTAEPPLLRPMLVVSGTTSPASRTMLARLVGAGLPVVPMPDPTADSLAPDSLVFTRWTETISAALSARGLAVAIAPGRIATGPVAATLVRAAFAALASRLHRAGAFRHLVIEGGATAAAIVQALRWDALDVTGEWSAGVITLSPAAQPDAKLTMKPGSYPWPSTWWERLCALGVPVSGEAKGTAR